MQSLDDKLTVFGSYRMLAVIEVIKFCLPSREFPLALDLGCGRGHIAKQLDRELVHKLVQVDYSPGLLVKISIVLMSNVRYNYLLSRLCE